MIKETEQKNSSSVDKGLVTIFLGMSPDKSFEKGSNCNKIIFSIKDEKKGDLL